MNGIPQSSEVRHGSSAEACSSTQPEARRRHRRRPPGGSLTVAGVLPAKGCSTSMRAPSGFVGNRARELRRNPSIRLVGPVGFEPTTNGL